MVKLLMALSAWLLVVSGALADCTSINRDATVKFKALTAAKEAYKQDFLDEQKKEFSPSSLDRAIMSTTKMKMAMDASIENLLQAQAQNCFGKDAAKWAAVIPELQRQSDELGRSREEFLAQQRAMQEVLKLNRQRRP